MSESERDIERAESTLPELSASAVNNAYNEALKQGLSVYISNHAEGHIFEMFPNGDKRIVKAVNAPISFPVGTKISISK